MLDVLGRDLLKDDYVVMVAPSIPDPGVALVTHIGHDRIKLLFKARYRTSISMTLSLNETTDVLKLEPDDIIALRLKGVID